MVFLAHFIYLSYACLPCLFDASSMHSYISVVAFHLDTLDVQRVDVEHVLTEPNHKAVFGGLILKREGPAGATEDPTQGRKGPRP